MNCDHCQERRFEHFVYEETRDGTVELQLCTPCKEVK